MVMSKRHTIGGAVSAQEKAEIARALREEGFASESAGIRTVALAYARMPFVRQLINAWRAQQERNIKRP